MQFLSPDHAPASTTSYQPPLCNRNIPHLIEPDDHHINNVLLRNSINAVMQESGELLEYRQLIKGPDASIWKRSLANDIGRLAQGVGGCIEGTNTFEFVHWKDIPKHKIVTYARIVSGIWPQKEDPN